MMRSRAARKPQRREHQHDGEQPSRNEEQVAPEHGIEEAAQHQTAMLARLLALVTAPCTLPCSSPAISAIRD